jgi:5-methylcytosine-specific restriction protein B
MSDRTVNELDDAITRRFAMIELRGYEEADRRKLYDDWLNAESVFEGETDVRSIDPTPESGFTPSRERLIDLFEAHHKGINEGGTTDEDTPITEFGPMHYRDVIQFVGVACGDDGAYATRHARAVGEAFATYQIERLADHYRTLDEAFSVFDLGPVVELVERQAETERRGIAGGAYE